MATKRHIKQFIELQEAVFMSVAQNRMDFHEDKITRTAYIKARTDIPKLLFTKLSRILTPTNNDFSWIEHSAIETLRQEDRLFSKRGRKLTLDETTKHCLLEAKHGNDFVDKLVKYNFNQFIGENYKSELLQDGFNVTDPEHEQFKTDIDDGYIDVRP